MRKNVKNPSLEIVKSTIDQKKSSNKHLPFINKPKPTTSTVTKSTIPLIKRPTYASNKPNSMKDLNEPPLIKQNCLNIHKISKEILHKSQKSVFYRMNYHIIKIICQYVVHDIRDLFILSYINKFFRNLIYNFHAELWLQLLGKSDTKFNDQESLILSVIQKQKNLLITSYEEFLLNVNKCFKHEFNTLNIPNKLIKKLDFILDIEISYGKHKIKKSKDLTLNLDNFNSLLYCECNEINQLNLNSENGKLTISLNFISKYLRKKIEIPVEIFNGDLQNNANNNKQLFLTYYLSPCLLYYFPNDTKIINCIISISGISLIFKLQKLLERLLKRLYQNPIKKVNNKSFPIKKTLKFEEIPINFDRFSHTLGFELFFRLYDRKTNFFSYFNTTSLPKILNKTEAAFSLEIKEALDKEIGVKIKDGLGIQENLKNICFFDLVLKDSSGFIKVISEMLVFSEMDFEAKNEFHRNLEFEKEEFQALKAKYETSEVKFTIFMIRDKSKTKQYFLENAEFKIIFK